MCQIATAGHHVSTGLRPRHSFVREHPRNDWRTVSPGRKSVRASWLFDALWIRILLTHPINPSSTILLPSFLSSFFPCQGLSILAITSRLIVFGPITWWSDAGRSWQPLTWMTLMYIAHAVQQKDKKNTTLSACLNQPKWNRWDACRAR